MPRTVQDEMREMYAKGYCHRVYIVDNGFDLAPIYIKEGQVHELMRTTYPKGRIKLSQDFDADGNFTVRDLKISERSCFS